MGSFPFKPNKEINAYATGSSPSSARCISSACPRFPCVPRSPRGTLSRPRTATRGGIRLFWDDWDVPDCLISLWLPLAIPPWLLSAAQYTRRRTYSSWAERRARTSSAEARPQELYIRLYFNITEETCHPLTSPTAPRTCTLDSAAPLADVRNDVHDHFARHQRPGSRQGLAVRILIHALLNPLRQGSQACQGANCPPYWSLSASTHRAGQGEILGYPYKPYGVGLLVRSRYVFHISVFLESR
jgi:hypothetical protein